MTLNLNTPTGWPISSSWRQADVIVENTAPT